jgi:hypothetical protein
MLLLHFSLRVSDPLFKGRQERGTVRCLDGAVAFHHPLRQGGMAPQLNPVGAVKGVSERVVVVIVGIERAYCRHLRYFTQRIHLKCRARGRDKALDQQRPVLAEEKPTIAHRGEALRRVRNRCVDTVSNLSHRRKPSVHYGCLREAGIVSERRRKSREGERTCEGEARAKISGLREKLPPGERRTQIFRHGSSEVKGLKKVPSV